MSGPPYWGRHVSAMVHMEDQKAEASDHFLHPKGSTASQNNMGTLVRTPPPARDACQNRGLKETFQVKIKAPFL